MSKLTASRVEKLFFDCMFTEEELARKEHEEDKIAVEGIKYEFVFNPQRVKQHAEEIKSLIEELPQAFKEGMSFLKLVLTKDGIHWGEHRAAEQLMVLGIASGKMEYCAPKSFWSALPGGVPYVVVKN